MVMQRKQLVYHKVAVNHSTKQKEIFVTATVEVQTLVYPCMSVVDETSGIFILVSDIFEVS